MKKTNKDRLYALIRTCAMESGQGENWTGITTNELGDSLHIARNNVSTLLNELVKEGRLEKTVSRPVHYRFPSAEQETDSFDTLIGSRGSLKNPIRLVKAALLYPGNCLPVLIRAQSGAGTSAFLERLIQYAHEKGVLVANAPIKRLNCIYASEEEQLNALREESEELGKLRGGLFCIHHFDDLCGRGQERLRNLMETEFFQKNRIFLICISNAAAAGVDGLSSAFPVQIELPPLEKRGLQERYELVLRFFEREAEQMDRVIEVSPEIMRCLLLYHCEKSLKQLRNDIRIGCANGYARNLKTPPEDAFPLYLKDFPVEVRKGFMLYRDYRDEIEQILSEGSTFQFSGNGRRTIPEKPEPINGIYDLIDKRRDRLAENHFEPDELRSFISAELEYDLSKRVSNDRQPLNYDVISKVVPQDVLTLAEDCLKEASQRFRLVYPRQVHDLFCFHLSEILRGHAPSQALSSKKIQETIQDYPEEYAFMLDFAGKCEARFHVDVSMEETILMTVMIAGAEFENRQTRRPAVLVAMHGNSGASSVADSANRLMDTDNYVHAYNLPLSKSMDEAYREFRQLIVSLDNGKGVLVIYDMGSIQTMCELIQQETGIQIRTIEVPITLIAVNAVLELWNAPDLNSACDSLQRNFKDSYYLVRKNHAGNEKKRVILALCANGVGGALLLKNKIEKGLSPEEYDVIPMAAANRRQFLKSVNLLYKEREICCAVGTVDPQLQGVHFVPASAVMECSNERLGYLLLASDSSYETQDVSYRAVFANLQDVFPDADMRKLRRVIPYFMREVKKFASLNMDQEIGLVMHVSCLIPKISAGQTLSPNPQTEQVIRNNKILYNDLKFALKKVETSFSVEIPDSEIAYMISLIKFI